jgi:hypothetical protein
MDNISDLNSMRRIKNLCRDINTYEIQLADLKKSTTILQKHREFYFFSITCHAMIEEQKKIAAELLRLRFRLDKAKNPKKYEFNGDTTNE